MLGDPYYVGIIWNSIKLALITTLATLIIGYPAAFALARAKGILQVVLFALIFLPLTVSIIVKTFGISIMMGRSGIINWLLVNLGFVERPMRLVFTEFNLYFGMVNVFLPFMILPLYSVMRMLDTRLTDAAASLGAAPLYTFHARDAAADDARRDRRRLARVLDHGRRLCDAQPADRRPLHDDVAGDGEGLSQHPRLPARRQHGGDHAGHRDRRRGDGVLAGARAGAARR